MQEFYFKRQDVERLPDFFAQMAAQMQASHVFFGGDHQAACLHRRKSAIDFGLVGLAERVMVGISEQPHSPVPFPEIVQQDFGLDVFSGSLFLFCGKRCDRIKALLWEEDGFVLLYKRLENGKYKWPRDSNEAKMITQQEFRWLLEGLSIEQKTAIKPAKKGKV